MNEPVVPIQKQEARPVKSVRFLLFGLAIIAAFVFVIQLFKGPAIAPKQQLRDKPTVTEGAAVKSFQVDARKQAQDIQDRMAEAERTMALQRELAGYRQTGDAPGVPPPTDAQRRSMESGGSIPPSGGSQSQGASVAPEKTAKQKAREEELANLKAGQESSAVAIDFSDQFGKAVTDSVENIKAKAEVEAENVAAEALDVKKPETGRVFTVLAGNLLECVLTNRLAGALTGPVNLMLTTPLYSHDRSTLLLPQGTRILGTVTSAKGQDERLFVAFHRAILPTGYSVSLDQFLGLSQQGQSGLRDQVNNHYFQIFGASVALAAIQGLGQAGGNLGSGGSATLRLQNGVGMGTENGSSRIIERLLARVPTFTVRERTRVKVYIAKDFTLPAYDPNFQLDAR